MNVEEALRTRRSVRGFLKTPVEVEKISRILELAARAPSGTNVQPWKVHVLSGSFRQQFTELILRAHEDDANTHTAEYEYYPKIWKEPYLSRRRKVGRDLYRLLDIAKTDVEQMARQHARNYDFFGAPVGLIFSMDRDLPLGNWLDHGMFLQSVMIAARGIGLDTCPQQAFVKYHRVIADVLHLPQSEMVVCGMALGYADDANPVNRLVTERMSLPDFVKFHSD